MGDPTKFPHLNKVGKYVGTRRIQVQSYTIDYTWRETLYVRVYVHISTYGTVRLEPILATAYVVQLSSGVQSSQVESVRQK